MRPRLNTVLLLLSGLLVAVCVGLAANAIASRSFTPGVDALPSAGSLAPTAGAKTTPPARGSAATVVPETGTTEASTTPVQSSPTPQPITTPDDHGGDTSGSSGDGGSPGKGSGKGGSGDSSGHGGKHGDD
jgi:uncharacterized membrane protein YgcG